MRMGAIRGGRGCAFDIRRSLFTLQLALGRTRRAGGRTRFYETRSDDELSALLLRPQHPPRRMAGSARLPPEGPPATRRREARRGLAAEGTISASARLPSQHSFAKAPRSPERPLHPNSARPTPTDTMVPSRHNVAPQETTQRGPTHSLVRAARDQGTTPAHHRHMPLHDQVDELIPSTSSASTSPPGPERHPAS